MTPTKTSKEIKRADLLLLALSVLQEQGDGSPPNRAELEDALARLGNDDQVGGYYRQYYRQALRHRAVIETLGYLETNGFIRSTLAVTESGKGRIAGFVEIRSEIGRAIKSGYLVA